MNFPWQAKGGGELIPLPIIHLKKGMGLCRNRGVYGTVPNIIT